MSESAPARAHPADGVMVESPGMRSGSNGGSRPNGSADGAASPAAVAPGRAKADGASSDVALADWDDLFSAVEARLTSTVGELLGVLPAPDGPASAERVRDSVLECVSALHQLHSTVAHELSRRQRLEFDLADARFALAQARLEFAGLRAERESAPGSAQPPHASH